VGRQKKPVLLIWGTKDAVLPFHNSEKVKAAVPHLLFHAIEGGGHNSNYENAVVANSILLKFFQDP
jgi:pimeloyl-ACP methyl ester carboxylesterase